MQVDTPQLTMFEAEEFRKALLDELEHVKQQFVLDLSKVEKIDFCGVQLLLSLKKYCDEKGVGLTLTNADAPRIRQAFAMLNMNLSK